MTLGKGAEIVGMALLPAGIAPEGSFDEEDLLLEESPEEEPSEAAAGSLAAASGSSGGGGGGEPRTLELDTRAYTTDAGTAPDCYRAMPELLAKLRWV